MMMVIIIINIVIIVHIHQEVCCYVIGSFCYFAHLFANRITQKVIGRFASKFYQVFGIETAD